MLEPVVRNLQSWGVLAPTTSDKEVSDRAEVLLALILLALALIFLVPTYFIFDQIEKYNERASVVRWTIRHISDVQVTIERLAIEIDQRDSKLSDLRDTCRKLDINWEKDPMYLRWEREVLELTKERESLVQTRNGAYLENYKAGLDSDLEYESPPRKMALHALREAHRVSRVIQDYRVPSSPRLEPAPPGFAPQTSSSP